MSNMDLTVQRDLEQGAWTDWKWQQQNAIRTIDHLLNVFPQLPESMIDAIKRNQESRRMQITPYTMSLIQRTEDGQAPDFTDPLWRMLIPYWESEGDASYSYDGETENWEMPEEMVTPIAQHKYQNRVIIRLSNVCHAYCQFCYEALRTIQKGSSKLSFQQKHWEDTVEYIRNHPEVEEVILSGGEPLMHSDEQLDRVLFDLRSLDRFVAIRIHTRALTFNPFRITDSLVEVLEKYDINSFGLHICHPNEVTDEFRAAIRKLRRVTPILFANMPLLGGVNDDVETMHELGMKLYAIGVIPQYLYHFIPHSPGALEFRTSVQKGVDIVRSLKRRISNLAVPEFVLPHTSGKHTMPLLSEGEEPPRRGVDKNGNPVIRYTNWRGQEVEYFDIP